MIEIPPFFIGMIGWICGYIIIRIHQYFFPILKPKIIYKTVPVMDDGWIDINVTPIPDPDEYCVLNVLATDGEKVVDYYRVIYNSNGKCCFGVLENTEITHWQPYPLPPKKGK